MIYAVCGGLWILLSDRAVLMIFHDPETISQVETCKGWLFIALTSVLLYLTLRAPVRRWEQQALMRATAEGALERKNRALRMLSDCNQALMRATEETGLLQEICRIAKEVGGYRMAWVGYAQEDEQKTVRIVAQAGGDIAQLNELDITWMDTPRGRGPTGIAIRTGKAHAVQDIHSAPSFDPWRTAIPQIGHSSVCALPLTADGRTFGALTIFAVSANAFPDEEIALLSELADDLSFGVSALRLRVAHAAAEEKLVWFRRLLDRSNDSIFLIDRPTGRILDANQTACQRLGYTHEELLRLTVLEVVGEPPDLQAWEARIRGLLGTGMAIFETRHFRKDGTSFPVEISTNVVEQEGGKYIIGLARDITERKQFEERQRGNEAMMATAQRIARFGSWELDLTNPDINANPLRWSDETFRIFGFEPRSVEVSNELFFQRIPEEERPRIAEAVARALRDRTEYSLSHRVILSSGETRFVQEQAKVFTDERTGAPVKMVGTVHDVTERMRLEEQLRQSQKMEAVGTLAGGVAHDFNNLLTVIQGHSSLLLARKPTEAEFTESISEIAEAAERAANLTRQLLIFSRKQVVMLAELDLNDVVANLTRMLRRIVGEDIELETSLAAQVPLVRCDRGMVEQIIVNLAANARDAMPRGGRLTIATSALILDERQAQEIADARPGPAVCLRISDTGCGIPPELLQHIFEPFFTTKEVGKGTGLGLATTYGIVKLHGGWIRVTSGEREGTTFEIFFPAVAGERAETKVEPASAPVGQGTETLLVVEDEAPVRMLITQLLRKWGYEVLEAATATDALEVWKAQRENISLLLTDMVMPDGISGRELAERLLAEKPELKVIYTSGYSAEVAAPGLSLVEGGNYLQKPYTGPRLAKTVRERLDQN